MRRICFLIAIVAALCLLHLGSVEAGPRLGFTSTPEPTYTPTDTPSPTYTPEESPQPTDTPSPSPLPSTPLAPTPTERAGPVAPPPSPTATPEPILPQSGADMGWALLVPWVVALVALAIICCRRYAPHRG